MRERNKILDILKGLGIICVILGHAPELIGLTAQHIIYMFHVPMFFYLSGYTSTYKSNQLEYLKKNFRRLVLPYIFTMFLTCCYGLFKSYVYKDYNIVAQNVLSFIWGSTNPIDTVYGSIHCGPMWFILTLFWARVFFQGILCLSRYLEKKIKSDIFVVGTCLILGISAILTFKFVRLPWCIYNGVTVLPFIVIGWYVKMRGIPNWLKIMAVAFIPFGYIFTDHMEVFMAAFDCLPLDIVSSLGIVLCLYWCVNKLFLILPNDNLFIIVQWIGINSMAVLCMHDFEIFSGFVYNLRWKLPIFMDENILIVFRICISTDALISYTHRLSD